LRNLTDTIDGILTQPPNEGADQAVFIGRVGVSVKSVEESLP
jgi:hypothetical protein